MNPRSENHRDRFRSIAAAIIPVTVAATPITLQPAMVQGMVDYIHLADAQAGYIAAAEVGGLMAATVAFAFVGGRLHWRMAYCVGLAVMVLANLLSTISEAGSVFIFLRIATGLGAGLATAIGFASLGETSNQPRNYGWAIASVMGYSALVLWAVPAIFDLGGYRALVIGYAIATALCLPLVPFLAHNRAAEGTIGAVGADDVRLVSARGSLAVLSLLIFFIGYAAAWTYMALLGRDAGLSERTVAYILSISQFCGVAGALTIAFLSGRTSEFLQAVAILAGGGLVILAFAAGQDYLSFLALNCLFQFAWNAGQPLLLGIIASRDRSGKLLRFAVPLQYVGMAIGPGLAAYLLGQAKDYTAVMVGSAAFATLTLIAILPIIMKGGQASFATAPGHALQEDLGASQ